jgi:hypothetical protein
MWKIRALRNRHCLGFGLLSFDSSVLILLSGGLHPSGRLPKPGWALKFCPVTSPPMDISSLAISSDRSPEFVLSKYSLFLPPGYATLMTQRVAG